LRSKCRVSSIRNSPLRPSNLFRVQGSSTRTMTTSSFL
jgi:hypothetical protein